MIVISTGIRKSGTSLAFEMAKAVLAVSGHEQERLSDALLGSTEKAVNAIDDLNEKRLVALARGTAGTKVVVRTHQPPNKLSVGTLFNLIDAGDVRIEVVVRDPRDTILSMLDEARVKTHRPKITTVDEGIERVGRRLDRLRRWCTFPSLVLRYEEIAFDRLAGPAAIAAHLGVDVDAEAVWNLVDAAFTRKNEAKPQRHRTEMSEEDSARVAAAFPEFLAFLEHGDRTWIDHR